MNIRLAIARLYLPDFIKKKKLKELFQLTAEAFQSDMPPINNLSYDNYLKAYANFTKISAENIIKSKTNSTAVKKRLYQNSFQLGQKLRKDFHLKTQKDVLLLMEIIYWILKIDFTGDLNGDIIIKHCFFSQFYTEEVCELISALDAGVAAGLSGGGELIFKERITQGYSCCLAKLTRKANLS